MRMFAEKIQAVIGVYAEVLTMVKKRKLRWLDLSNDDSIGHSEMKKKKR